jgi:hypothetical protein
MIQKFHQFFENRYLIDSIWSEKLNDFIHYRRITSSNIGKYIGINLTTRQINFLNRNKFKFVVGVDDNDNLLCWFSYIIINGINYFFKYKKNSEDVHIDKIREELNMKIFEWNENHGSSIQLRFVHISEIPPFLLFVDNENYSFQCVNTTTKKLIDIDVALDNETKHGRINTDIYIYENDNEVKLLGLKVITDIKTGSYDTYLWSEYSKYNYLNTRLPYDEKYNKIIVYSEYDGNYYYYKDCFLNSFGYMNISYKDIELSTRRINFNNRIQSYNFFSDFIKNTLRRSKWSSTLDLKDKLSFKLDSENKQMFMSSEFYMWNKSDSTHNILFGIKERHNGYRLTIIFTWRKEGGKENKITHVENFSSISEMKGDKLSSIAQFLHICKGYLIDKESKYSKKGRSKRNR